MSHREEHTSRSKIDCGSSRSARRTSADTGCSSDRCRQHDADSGGFMQDISRHKNAVRDLECKLERERRQNKETIDELLRQRNALQYRYKMKELRIQEIMLQFKQFKDNQAPTYQRLRQCFLEPSVNLIFEKMKAEVDENKRAKEEAISDLHAWSFTAESQTGKRLVARCKKLLQENEEFGKMVTSGNVAKLNTEIAMQKRLIEEMHANEREYDALVLEMDEELDLLTCACKQLQNKLYESVRLGPSGKDVPVHKMDGKQSARRAVEGSHLIARQLGASVQQDVYKPNPSGRRETISSPTMDHNGIMTGKRASEAASKQAGGITLKHTMGTRPTGHVASNAVILQQVVAKQPPSPRITVASRQPGRNTHHGKDETSLASPRTSDHMSADLKAPDKGAESNKLAPPATGKSAKQPVSSQESSIDDQASKLKARVSKPPGGKDDAPQKQSDSGEKRRKPVSNESPCQVAQPSNPPKNKRRARRLSSEEQERHANKIQNLGSSKENQYSLLIESQSKQDNPGDGSRHSPLTHSSPGVSSRAHRPADQARRPAGGKATKGSRANWDMDHSLSPGHNRQRDGIRSSVNKTSSSVNKSRSGQGINGSSGRKLDGRRSSPGYRYGEPRRRRHSPARNYR